MWPPRCDCCTAAKGWGRAAFTSLVAFLLAAGACSSAQSQGTPPPPWFRDMVIVPGVLTIVCVVAAVVATALLRRRSPAVRAQAVPLAAHHPGRPHAPPLPAPAPGLVGIPLGRDAADTGGGGGQRARRSRRDRRRRHSGHPAVRGGRRRGGDLPGQAGAQLAPAPAAAAGARLGPLIPGGPSPRRPGTRHWLSYSSWRRHQNPFSLRPSGARSSHWYMPHRPSRPREYAE
jgi:hypothetical protein